MHLLEFGSIQSRYIKKLPLFLLDNSSGKAWLEKFHNGRTKQEGDSGKQLDSQHLGVYMGQVTSEKGSLA